MTITSVTGLWLGPAHVELSKRGRYYLLRTNFAPGDQRLFTRRLEEEFGDDLYRIHKDEGWVAAGLPWGFSLLSGLSLPEMLEKVRKLLTECYHPTGKEAV